MPEITDAFLLSPPRDCNFSILIHTIACGAITDSR
jgi:hypothetical protein